MKVSVIIPVYNEQKTIKHVIESVHQSGLKNKIDLEIIVVDDCSTDGTEAVLRKLKPIYKLSLLFQEKNMGKGACVRKGIASATGDIVIIQDADLEYNPDDYPSLIDPILRGEADVVYGSRFMNGPRRVLYFWHTVGNKLLTLFTNIITNLNLTDMETGYKAFRTEIIRNIYLRCNRFDFEPEVTIKLAKMKVRMYEVPISYRGRTYEEGKKVGWKDGLAAIFTILQCALRDDKDGRDIAYTTLIKMRKLKRYNRWMFEKIEKYIGNTVMEIGSGIGNITKFLINKKKVIATDIDQKYLLYLKNTFERCPNIIVRNYNLLNPPDASLRSEKADTIICLNVLEHIKDDLAALKHLYEILAPKGRIILLVPAMKQLYGTLDKHLEHYRRYDKDEICKALESVGFKIIHSEYFNFIGAFGWYFSSKILKSKILPSNQLRLINLVVNFLKLEKYFKLKMGLSLIAVGEK